MFLLSLLGASIITTHREHTIVLTHSLKYLLFLPHSRKQFSPPRYQCSYFHQVPIFSPLPPVPRYQYSYPPSRYPPHTPLCSPLTPPPGSCCSPHSPGNRVLISQVPVLSPYSQILMFLPSLQVPMLLSPPTHTHTPQVPVFSPPLDKSGSQLLNITVASAHPSNNCSQLLQVAAVLTLPRV